MIRVIIPHHLRNLAGTGAEVSVEVAGPATQRAVLDALEARYPVSVSYTHLDVYKRQSLKSLTPRTQSTPGKHGAPFKP